VQNTKIKKLAETRKLITSLNKAHVTRYSIGATTRRIGVGLQRAIKYADWGCYVCRKTWTGCSAWRRKSKDSSCFCRQTHSLSKTLRCWRLTLDVCVSDSVPSDATKNNDIFFWYVNFAHANEIVASRNVSSSPSSEFYSSSLCCHKKDVRVGVNGNSFSEK